MTGRRGRPSRFYLTHSNLRSIKFERQKCLSDPSLLRLDRKDQENMTEHYDASRVPSIDRTRQEPLMTVSHPHPMSGSSDSSSLKEVKDPTGEPTDRSDATAPVDVFPGDHGDWRAILCSVGAFFTLFIGFGILNIPGTFVTYWESNQLIGIPQSTVGWIAAVQFFLTLFGSVLTGRFFDLHGGKVAPWIWDRF